MYTRYKKRGFRFFVFLRKVARVFSGNCPLRLRFICVSVARMPPAEGPGGATKGTTPPFPEPVRVSDEGSAVPRSCTKSGRGGAKREKNSELPQLVLKFGF